MLTTYNRRQRLLVLLQEQPGIRIPEQAKLLEVSEGTIRNDLKSLAETGQLTRVRGGAVLMDDHSGASITFATRARANTAVKRRIARCAASLVDDGDSILLDASTTVYNLTHFLKDHHNLTVITNGIEVGRELARNTSNTVILIGGVLRADGTSITGSLGEQLLEGLHIKTAFVSSSGFSLEAGLTEIDIHEVSLKRKMIELSNSVVALIDSSKFGKVDLTPFAQIQQLNRVFTDMTIDKEWMDYLAQAGVTVTICHEEGTFTTLPRTNEAHQNRIGFAGIKDNGLSPAGEGRGVPRVVPEAGNMDAAMSDTLRWQGRDIKNEPAAVP